MTEIEKIDKLVNSLTEKTNEISNKLNNVIELIHKLKGRKMNYDDLDSLLDDLDLEETIEKATPEPTPEPTPEALGDSPVAQDDLDDITPIEKEAPAETSDDGDSAEIEALKREIEVLKAALVEDQVPASETQQVAIDFPEETKAYARAYLDIELRKQVLQQEARDLKEEYKEQGVDTVATAKAMREIGRKMKQSPDEAQQEQLIEDFIHSDDDIVTTISALNG